MKKSHPLKISWLIQNWLILKNKPQPKYVWGSDFLRVTSIFTFVIIVVTLFPIIILKICLVDILKSNFETKTRFLLNNRQIKYFFREKGELKLFKIENRKKWIKMHIN